MGDRPLPFSDEAEQAVLGSLLIDTEAYDLIADQIRPEDFYISAHQTIFETICILTMRHGRADFVTLSEELTRTDKMKHAGRKEYPGESYLASLINLVPTSANVEHYARIVNRLAECRRVIHAAGQIAALAYMGEDGAIEQAEKILFALQRGTRNGSFDSMPTIMGEYMEELDYLQAYRGSIVGVPTGFKDLDICLGGLQKSDSIILAARPAVGKTSFALSIAYNAAHFGKKVAVISLEMGKRQLARRLMSMHSKINQQRLRAGWVEDHEWETVIGAVRVLSDLPIWIDDTAGSPIASIRSKVRRLIQEQGGIDLLIIDYLGLIEPDTDASKRDNLVQQVTAISKGLKSLAREFDIPVLTLCQLSRAVETRQDKKPLLSDLRDSGSVEQDADIVLFIYREDVYNPETERKNIADIIVAKQRNGPTGEISLYFQKNQTMFYNLDEIPVS